MYTVPEHKYFSAHFSLITTFAKFIAPSNAKKHAQLNYFICSTSADYVPPRFPMFTMINNINQNHYYKACNKSYWLHAA